MISDVFSQLQTVTVIGLGRYVTVRCWTDEIEEENRAHEDSCGLMENIINCRGPEQ